MSERTRKIESQLKEIVGSEVADLSDPRVHGLVTVTSVRVSPDLAHATVLYSVIDSSDEAEADARAGLQSAAGRIQATVAQQTRMRRTPRLRFEPDPMVERTLKIEAALREVRNGNE